MGALWFQAGYRGLGVACPFASSEENFASNLEFVASVKAMAERKGCTPAQIALAWISSKGFVSIPGTRRPARLIENIGALNVELAAEDLTWLNQELFTDKVKGERYT